MPRPALQALARRAGILPHYLDIAGRRRETTDAARVAVLGAMGLDADTETAARRALAALRDSSRALLAPVRVVRAGSSDAATVLLDAAARRGGRATLELVEEDGRTSTTDVRGRAPFRGGLAVRLPHRAPPGYHTVRLHAGGAIHTQRLIVTPSACPPVAGRVGRHGAFGLIANLYAVRSAQNWGVGDLGDLARLAGWAAGAGAAFVGVNPLHALTHRGADISPYSPITRLYRSEIYLDVDAVPELAHSAEARALVEGADGRRTLAAVRRGDHVPYHAVTAFKAKVLRVLHAEFVRRHGAGRTGRGRAYAAYVAREGQALRDYAVFRALDGRFGRRGPPDARRWPARYRDARGAAVAAFAREHEGDVAFHCYLQFELDRQLAAAARRASAMPIGLYTDLAIGSSPGGCDPWARPALFAAGAELGAPPDDFAPEGQHWGLPPLVPARLAADGYDYIARLFRAGFAHAGALRVDHVMGLFRQFWIPRGRTGAEGAYVRQPSDDLLGILALEATRAGAIVIGEDLGTVPRGLPRVLARWNILSSRLLYFERDRRGAFRPPARWSSRALVTVATHDHVPLDGFRAGRDIALAREVGRLKGAAALNLARRERARTLRLLERLLVREGVLDPDDAGDPAGFAAAVYALLARTPSPLAGVTLDDLAGETEPVNLPGVLEDRHRNWSRRLHLSLAELRAAPRARALLDALSRPRGTRPLHSGSRPG